MKCTTCGANLPQGATSCPLCGTPTPYNVAGSGSSPQYDPTVVAPQPQYGMPPSSGQSPIDPTIAASPYGGTPPSTAYGSPAYGAPPPPQGQNPYEVNANNPYNSPTIPQYGMPPGQQSAYGAPPMQGGYAPPQQVPGPGGYGYSPPPKRRSRVGLIVAIVLIVVLLACVGVSVFIYEAAKTGISAVTATVTAAVSTETSIPTTTDTTPTTSTSTSSPSGQTVDPTAAGIITNLQMASSVDTNTAVATKLATTFTPQQTVYATVSLNMGGQTGYAQAKWYGNGSLIRTSVVLNINNASDTNAYFYFSYGSATQGAVEIYWCTQSDCSDAKLAATTTFTVSATSIHWQNQPPVVFSDINRP